MDNFSISCMKLLNDYPLYDYATELDDGSKLINVLLLGSGSRMETVLQQVLTCGQMLDTDLDVTLVNSNASATADSFMRRTPAAGQFIRVIKSYETITKPTTQLGTIRFESADLTPEAIPDILLARNECSYILISTGNVTRNQALADACTNCEAEQHTLVAYVQDNVSQESNSVNPSKIQVQAFGAKRDISYFAETGQIAFNLHYIYEKSRDSRMPMEQIKKNFREPYNYVSNIEAAVHVRTKLACCGIDSGNLKLAASSFRKALQADPPLLERLSLMEHNRWLMSKILKGYVPIPDVNLIYSAPEIGTHDSTAKWHCCIVPCNMDGSSHIEESDWDIPSSLSRQALDPLDRMTLLIHETCKKISDENRPRIEQIMQTLSNSLRLDTGYSIETVECERRLETAIAQLWAEKKSAIPLYRRESDKLLAQIHKEGSAQSFIYKNLIELLNQVIAPLIEYVSQKDYKEQDRILVEQIPYALTRNPELTLGKALSKNLFENLCSAWQFDPRCVAYITVVRSEADLIEVSNLADHITRFLKYHCGDTMTEFHVLAPETLAFSQLEMYRDRGFEIHWVGDLSVSNIADAVKNLSMKAGVCDFDVSGGEPLVNYAINLCAAQLNAGVFYLQSGRLYNLYGAEEFEYRKPQKSLTAQEMFDLSGSAVKESETPHLVGLPSQYKALWQIAQESIYWDAFCKDISSAYHAGLRRPFVFSPSQTAHPDVMHEITGSIEATTMLLPALRKLEQFECLKEISITRELGNLQTINYTLAENVADPIQLEEFLKRAMTAFRSGTSFSVGWFSGHPSLRINDLFVRALNLPEDRKEEYEGLLQQLEKQNFILNHRTDKISLQHSFSFASHEILTCFQKSGNVLERLIYFSAVFDGHFDDVELGWKFLHTTEPDSAENEIDIICTKGFRSLFISAKMVSAQQLTYGNNLNYILYEISLLANRFGINATPVLVAPALKQFRENPQSGQRELSSVVKTALRRGVYLIGEECIQQELLGQTLDKIISGGEYWYDF